MIRSRGSFTCRLSKRNHARSQGAGAGACDKHVHRRLGPCPGPLPKGVPLGAWYVRRAPDVPAIYAVCLANGVAEHSIELIAGEPGEPTPGTATPTADRSCSASAARTAVHFALSGAGAKAAALLIF